jgi:hypothetical protein
LILYNFHVGFILEDILNSCWRKMWKKVSLETEESIGIWYWKKFLARHLVKYEMNGSGSKCYPTTNLCCQTEEFWSSITPVRQHML